MKNNKILTLVLFIIFVVIVAFLSLRDKNNPISSIGETPSGIQDSQCYVAKLAKDVYVLKIEKVDGSSVSGVLAYNNFEKDSSSGVFEGSYSGDTLIGNYSFTSEGMDSNRQVIFKKDGDNLVQSFGDVKQEGDKEIFSDINKVSYDPKLTFVKNPNCSEVFTDKNNTVTFAYDPMFYSSGGPDTLTTDWRMNSKDKGIILSRISIPRVFMPKTNFSGASMLISRSSESNAIKTCNYIDVKNNEKSAGMEDIGKYNFTKFVYSDVALGNRYDTTSYRGIVDGDCYVVEYTIHSTNIGNYSPDQGVKEFDKMKVQDELEKIIKTITFLVNSD